MLFNSAQFLFFFPLVTLLYFLLKPQYRWALLLGASCYFYMFFKPVYILILFFTIIIDYYAGKFIEREQNKRRRRLLLIVSILSNVLILAFFKYYNFLNDNITGLANLIGFQNPIPYLSILLPIGLSFHTFQAMSYTIEVYRGHQKAEQHFGIYALYVMFYPQLVAGPIERPQNILHQFHETKTFRYENAVNGLNLMAYGMFKKVVIADRLAEYVSEIYSQPAHYTTIPIIIATVFFSIQIYCDFSGYSDIAIGAAKVMGYDLMLNFNRPYLSHTISEFWTRWHISLSTWFRDYVYIPLGGNRTTRFKWYRNLVIVFLLSGLWHGASWNFIIWGALHAFYLVFGLLTLDLRKKISAVTGLGRLPKLNALLQMLTTFALVTFAWIFFRAETFDQSCILLKKILQFDLSVNIPRITTKLGALNLFMCFMLIILLFVSYSLPRNLDVRFKTFFFIVVTILIILLGSNGTGNFIYFQF
jgi:D-alanyl-lipoteichoic acid acyltransferase DltB (MBOAT superfamily)